jgi:hypothetical protein
MYKMPANIIALHSTAPRNQLVYLQSKLIKVKRLMYHYRAESSLFQDFRQWYGVSCNRA